MKALTILLLSALCAHAQVAIYKTTGHQTVIGSGATTKLSVHGYLVLDLVSGSGTTIGAFTLNHQKAFVVVAMQNYQFVQPQGTGGVVYDVLAKAVTPGDAPNSLLESSFIQGKEVSVNITTNGPANIPRTFVMLGQSIVNPNGTLGVIGTSIASATGSLDIKGSMTANTNGDTLDTVVSSLTAKLQALGYVNVTP